MLNGVKDLLFSDLRYGILAAVNGQHRGRSRRRILDGEFGSGVTLVDRDVETGLAKLIFDIDLTRLLQRNQPGAQPADLLCAEALLGDVDGAAGKMRRGDVAIGSRGVAVDVAQMALV